MKNSNLNGEHKRNTKFWQLLSIKEKEAGEMALGFRNQVRPGELSA